MPQPVRWREPQKSSTLAWIYEELQQALRDRSALERQWLRWLDLYKAPAQQAFKRFPFEGAHNIMLPAGAIDADTMIAAFMQTIHAPDNIWSLEPLNERWVNAAKPMQDFLQAIDARLLKMFDVNYRVVMEMVKLGTGIYKTGWSYEKRPIRTYDDKGNRIQKVLVKTKPFADHVRLSDFVLPTYSYAIQPDRQGGAPWVAERLRVSPWQFQQMATAVGDFLPQFDPEAVTKVMQWEIQKQTQYDEKVTQQQYQQGPFASGTFNTWDKNTNPETSPGNVGSARVREIELWEIHARCPTEGQDLQDVILWYHLDSQTLLRAIYADWLSGERPYDVIRYMRGEGFYGIGVLEQKEVFQTVGSDILNFALDNMVLGNSTMIGARAGANVAPGEPVYPGKVWVTDGAPRDDIFPMTLGTPGNAQSILGAFSLLQGIGERRTGVSDIQLGQMQDLPGRTPATTMLSLLQEGKRRPDLTIKDLRFEGLSAVGLKVLQALQQQIAQPSSGAGEVWLQWAVDLLGMPEGQEVAQKLITPAENVALGLGVSLTATSSTANKEVAKQSYLGLMQTAGQVAGQIMQMYQVAMQFPPLLPVAQAATKAQVALFTRLLEQYDIRNIDEILPAPSPVGAPVPAGAGGPPPAQPVGGPNGQPQGAGGLAQLAGMAGMSGPPMGA